MAGALRVALNLPRPVRVRTGRGGTPVEVDGQAIELVRESWLVEDRWWTAQPLRRRYWEAVTTSGRNVVVFHDLTTRARVAGGSRGSRGAHSPQGWVSPQDWVPQGWVSPQDWVPQGWFVQGP